MPLEQSARRRGHLPVGLPQLRSHRTYVRLCPSSERYISKP